MVVCRFKSKTICKLTFADSVDLHWMSMLSTTSLPVEAVKEETSAAPNPCALGPTAAN